MPNPTDFFLEVTQALLAEPGVHRGTMMGLPCLRVDGTFFASSDTGSGGLIVKLPADRVEMMVASVPAGTSRRTAERFASGYLSTTAANTAGSRCCTRRWTSAAAISCCGRVGDVIFHTDQGGEYTGALFTRACTAAGVRQSMGPHRLGPGQHRRRVSTPH